MTIRVFGPRDFRAEQMGTLTRPGQALLLPDGRSSSSGHTENGGYEELA